MGEEPGSLEGEKQVAHLDRLSRNAADEKLSFQ